MPDKPLRVLQVFTVLNKGGAETNIMNYYRNIDRSRLQFDFLVHRKEPGFYEEEIRKLGGKIYRLPPLHPLRLSAYKRAVSDFFDKHAHYSIIHGHLSELGLFIYQEARKRGVPVIIAHAHNSKMDLDVKAPFRWLWKRKMLSYINQYFTCGADSAVWLFGEKRAASAYQMNNAVNTSDFAYQKEKSRTLRQSMGIADSKNIIHVGRFNIQKNHDFLIKIFNELLKLDPTYRLFLVGNGELEGAIREQVQKWGLQEQVQFLGLRHDVHALLQAMDYFLFPSRFEGFSVAFVEAQSSGIRCFISDAVPSESILVKENTFALHLSENAPTWAQKIQQNSIYERKDVQQQIIDAGYDIQENARLLTNKYLQMLEECKRP